MKKIIYLTITALAVVACKEEPKDYVTFSGKITNQNSDYPVQAHRPQCERSPKYHLSDLLMMMCWS